MHEHAPAGTDHGSRSRSMYQSSGSFGIHSALHQDLRAADVDQLLDLLEDLIDLEGVGILFVTIASERAEGALGGADVRVVDVPVDDVGPHLFTMQMSAPGVGPVARVPGSEVPVIETQAPAHQSGAGLPVTTSRRTAGIKNIGGGSGSGGMAAIRTMVAGALASWTGLEVRCTRHGLLLRFEETLCNWSRSGSMPDPCPGSASRAPPLVGRGRGRSGRAAHRRGSSGTRWTGRVGPPPWWSVVGGPFEARRCR